VKRDTIGFDRDIEPQWLDAAAARVAAGDKPDEVRVHLWRLLEGKVAGDASRSGRGKTATVLVHVWSDVPDNVVPLRDECLKALSALSGEQQLICHWAMAIATYPFFLDVVGTVGRVLALQGRVSLAQVTRRIAEKWGERSTAVRACRRVVRSIVRWGAMQDTRAHGVYSKRQKQIVAGSDGSLLLAEAVLVSTGAAALPLSSLLSHPALFPFDITLNAARLRASGRLQIAREGLDVEMVRLTNAYERLKQAEVRRRVRALS
jgi:hypothetical protein